MTRARVCLLRILTATANASPGPCKCLLIFPNLRKTRCSCKRPGRNVTGLTLDAPTAERFLPGFDLAMTVAWCVNGQSTNANQPRKSGNRGKTLRNLRHPYEHCTYAPPGFSPPVPETTAQDLDYFVWLIRGTAATFCRYGFTGGGAVAEVAAPLNRSRRWRALAFAHTSGHRLTHLHYDHADLTSS